MILILLEQLTQLGYKVPSVFFYASTRMILAALTTLLFTIFLGPWFIRKLYEMKTGQSIRVDDCPLLVELHKKKKNTPTMGGILILSSMLLALFLWVDLRSSFTLILFFTTVWLGGIGALDDYLKMKRQNSQGLAGRKKIALQLLFAALLALYLLYPPFAQLFSFNGWFVPSMTQKVMGTYYLPFFKDSLFILSGLGLMGAFLITLFVVVGSSNAVNLTDGLDGLAAGCVLMVAVVFSLIAFLSNHVEIARYLNILYIEESGEIAVYMAALAGAALGFLWYNGYPAQVFMGDTGSLALGGILGVTAVLLRREFLFALVGGIFVIEVLSVILQVGSYKLRNKQRIFLCSPLHHHFEYKGWPETKVVLRFWIIGLILAIVGVASLKFQ